MTSEKLLPAEPSFPEREKLVLELWRDLDAFSYSLKLREGSKVFTFYDGPPFATGLPHYGHLLAGTIKDVIPRFKTMQGFYVPRRFGWDCHGLPVENEIERHFDLTGTHSIEEFGVPRFNEECRSIVLRYTEEWKVTVERMGRWVDFSCPYRTMDASFMESVWWVFAQLWDKGMVYEGLKVMPFSWKLGTPLSNFEANLNYKEVDDPAITVMLPLAEDPSVNLLIWTTTPWTLPSNLAAVVHPELDYIVALLDCGTKVLLAEGRATEVLKDRSFEVVARYTGRQLQGKRYQPPFDCFKHLENSAFRILNADFVSLDDGTGVVHAAPGFGEEDFNICQREGIALVCPVDSNGCFTEEVPHLCGRFVKDTDRDIIQDLKQRGLLFHRSSIRHRYPFCWRSDTPLIYKSVKTWFVAVEPLKERLLAANAQIQWVPDHIRDGRFGKWLAGARDWAISRNRYWGTPMPIWRSESGRCLVISSIEQLQKLAGVKVTDLHRHFLDDIEIEVEGEVYRRIPEVFDCWFESGSMPYASKHYPFEAAKEWNKSFPADFIAEGIDQTRGWFYTLTVLAVALFDKPAFLNCIVNGIVLASDGQKMSKRLKNYPEPGIVINKYGADAVRIYLLNSPAVEAEDLCFQESGVEHVLRQLLIPAWNSLRFFTTYARLHNWSCASAKPAAHQEIDQWIRAALKEMLEEVTRRLESYQIKECFSPILKFIDQLTNWYIRRSRRKFWSEPTSDEQRSAYHTLYDVLLNFAKVLAPFAPFLAEQIWQELRTEQDPKSVHWCDWPTWTLSEADHTLLRDMEVLRTAVSLGHSVRKQAQVKVRQPLRKALIAVGDEVTKSALSHHAALLAEELNVHEVELLSDAKELVRVKIKPNFRVLGKRVGAMMPQFQKAIMAEGLTLQRAMSTALVEGSDYILQEDDLMLEYEAQEGITAASEGALTIALITELDEELLLEGIARDLVNRVNQLRKESGLDISDRITLILPLDETLKQVWSRHGGTIADDVLATSIEWGPALGGTEFELPTGSVIIGLMRATSVTH